VKQMTSEVEKAAKNMKGGGGGRGRRRGGRGGGGGKGGGRGRHKNKKDGGKRADGDSTEEDDQGQPYGTAYWTEQKKSLRDKLKQELSLDEFCKTSDNWKAFCEGCIVVQDAAHAVEKAKKEKEKAAKVKPKDEDLVAKTQKEFDDATALFEDAKSKVEKEIVPSLLQEMEGNQLKVLFTKDFDDADLVKFVCLDVADPKRLATWCSSSKNDGDEKESDATAQAVIDLFEKAPETLREMLLAGDDGPRDGNFARALDIRRQLRQQFPKDEDDDPVLRRLALAVSLELAGDVPRKVGDPKSKIDPLARYKHYRDAYLEGELDPAFSQFTAWEMRYAVDSDADEDALKWGRESLKNYRPDIACSNNPQWRYAQIVKTDVKYGKPDWFRDGPSTYDQILSGGGKCGPRYFFLK